MSAQSELQPLLLEGQAIQAEWEEETGRGGGGEGNLGDRQDLGVSSATREGEHEVGEEAWNDTVVPLVAGCYTIEGEARDMHDAVYRSDMRLKLEEDGKVTGDSTERGKFVRGQSVAGKILGGKWWAEGYVEMLYVFWDGSTYTYRGHVDMPSGRYHGHWYVRDLGWEGSNKLNRGWFGFTLHPAAMRSRGWGKEAETGDRLEASKRKVESSAGGAEGCATGASGGGEGGAREGARTKRKSHRAL